MVGRGGKKVDLLEILVEVHAENIAPYKLQVHLLVGNFIDVLSLGLLSFRFLLRHFLLLLFSDSLVGIRVRRNILGSEHYERKVSLLKGGCLPFSICL